GQRLDGGQLRQLGDVAAVGQAAEVAVDGVAEATGDLKGSQLAGDGEAGLVQGGGVVLAAPGLGEAGQQPEAVGQALVGAGQPQPGGGGGGGGGRDGGRVAAPGDEADDLPPRGGVGQGAQARVAHRAALLR